MAQASLAAKSELQPMPTRSPSAPASSSGLAWRGATTLPQTTSRFGYLCFTRFRKSSCASESPCAASSTMQSAPASTSFVTRSPSPGFTAAATRSCLLASCAASGCARLFLRSPRLTSATSSPPSLMIGSLPFRLARSFSCACDMEMGSMPNFSSSLGVMMSVIRVFLSSTRSISRLVTMPMSLLPMEPLSVTSTVEQPVSCLRRSTSSTVLSGGSTLGSMMKPCS
mmetsp:Transcript_83935/g.216016  ORF Transcript_83935/g.216016 Transcript_83935/m.216016 type:complete len:226 (-) Transcript_83935:345-1022(-)